MLPSRISAIEWIRSSIYLEGNLMNKYKLFVNQHGDHHATVLYHSYTHDRRVLIVVDNQNHDDGGRVRVYHDDNDKPVHDIKV